MDDYFSFIGDNFLNLVIKEYNIDIDRVYLTGFSMGGYLTWRYLVEHPNQFAAIAPVTSTLTV